MSDVTREWLEKLPKMGEDGAMAEIRRVSGDLYRAKHGRAPQTADERRVAMELLSEEADRAKGSGATVPVSNGDYRPGFRPLTLADRRALDDEADRVDRWFSGW